MMRQPHLPHYPHKPQLNKEEAGMMLGRGTPCTGFPSSVPRELLVCRPWLVRTIHQSVYANSFLHGKDVTTICQYTNRNAAKGIAKGRKFKWAELKPTEFGGLLFYMAILQLPRLVDHWRQRSFFTVPFPHTPHSVMTRDRFLTIARNVHEWPRRRYCQWQEKGHSWLWCITLDTEWKNNLRIDQNIISPGVSCLCRFKRVVYALKKGSWSCWSVIAHLMLRI